MSKIMRNSPFTTEEKEFIERHYHKTTIQELADALGRSYGGVKTWCRKLGLSRIRYQWTPERIQILKQMYPNNPAGTIAERLMDDDDEGMDVGKARAVAIVGKVIVESAKAETQFLQAVRHTPVKNSFISAPGQSEQPRLLPDSTDEMPDCRCGESILPSDLERCERLGLNYPRCTDCLDLLPTNSTDLNGGGK